jgi:preprotein translocase subunit SecE
MQLILCSRISHDGASCSAPSQWILFTCSNSHCKSFLNRRGVEIAISAFCSTDHAVNILHFAKEVWDEIRLILYSFDTILRRRVACHRKRSISMQLILCSRISHDGAACSAPSQWILFTCSNSHCKSFLNRRGVEIAISAFCSTDHAVNILHFAKEVWDEIRLILYSFDTILRRRVACHRKRSICDRWRAFSNLT